MALQIPERKVLQYGLFLPLAAPFILLPLNDTTGDSVGTQVSLTLMISFIFGGLPYALFVVALLWWGRGKGTARILSVAWKTPLLFAPIAALLVAGGTAYWSDPGHRLEWAPIFGVFSLIYALILGYGYVLIVLSLRWLLNRAGVLRSDDLAKEATSCRTTG